MSAAAVCSTNRESPLEGNWYLLYVSGLTSRASTLVTNECSTGNLRPLGLCLVPHLVMSRVCFRTRGRGKKRNSTRGGFHVQPCCHLWSAGILIAMDRWKAMGTLGLLLDNSPALYGKYLHTNFCNSIQWIPIKYL